MLGLWIGIGKVSWILTSWKNRGPCTPRRGAIFSLSWALLRDAASALTLGSFVSWNRLSGGKLAGKVF